MGEAFHLKVVDHIYGIHLSHFEIIAKSLRAIHELKGSGLREIMENYFGGAILKMVETHEPDWEGLRLNGKRGGKAKTGFTSDEEEEIGIDFLLYGLLSEIFGRENGFNRGMGGSMHAFFIPFGVFPNNAIVGGSADIATGAALYKRVRRQEGIVVANIGDASIGCGPVWEGLQFAAMAQFKNLWEDGCRADCPSSSIS